MLSASAAAVSAPNAASSAASGACADVSYEPFDVSMALERLGLGDRIDHLCGRFLLQPRLSRQDLLSALYAADVGNRDATRVLYHLSRGQQHTLQEPRTPDLDTTSCASVDSCASAHAAVTTVHPASPPSGIIAVSDLTIAHLGLVMSLAVAQAPVSGAPVPAPLALRLASTAALDSASASAPAPAPAPAPRAPGSEPAAQELGQRVPSPLPLVQTQDLVLHAEAQALAPASGSDQPGGLSNKQKYAQAKSRARAREGLCATAPSSPSQAAAPPVDVAGLPQRVKSLLQRLQVRNCSAEAVRDACKAVSKLSATDLQHFVRGSGVQWVFDVMDRRRRSPIVQVAGCSALIAVSKVAHWGFTPVLSALKGHADNERVVLSSLRAALEMLWAYADDFVTLGGVFRVCLAMPMHPSSFPVQSLACHVLQLVVSIDCSEAKVKCVLRQGALPCVLAVLRAYIRDEEVVESTCSFLACVARYAAGGRAMQAAGAQALLEAVMEVHGAEGAAGSAYAYLMDAAADGGEEAAQCSRAYESGSGSGSGGSEEEEEYA